MSDFNHDLLREINSLRTNPRKYARKIYSYIDYFKGKLLYLPGSNAGIQTEEGSEAYREAADYLSRHSRIEALKPSKGLCRIAEDFILSVQSPNSNDFEKIDMEEIINKYGSFNGSFSRALDFGGETPEQALINLIVSDGDKTRGQRESLLSTDIKRIGVANGEHKAYRHCSAIVTCTEFENAVDEDDNGLLEEEEEIKPSKIQKTKKQESNEDQRDEQEKPKGVTLKAKKIVLSNDKEKNLSNDNEDEKEENIEELPPGVKSINKKETIIMENGTKKKITRIEKVMEDGAKEIETTKEVIK